MESSRSSLLNTGRICSREVAPVAEVDMASPGNSIGSGEEFPFTLIGTWDVGSDNYPCQTDMEAVRDHFGRTDSRTDIDLSSVVPSC
jgi:hypothetical protein